MAEKAKYIDVKELSIILDTMKNPDSEFATDDYIDGFSDGISAAIKELEAFPTADVAPVKHGHFRRLTFSGDTIICSECKMAYNIFETNGAENFNFCPHCGARMDKTE